MAPDPVALGHLGLDTLALLAAAAFLIGFAKTGIGGAALVSVAVFAAVLPPKLSTGVVLGLLLVGDVVAVRTYHAHADWRTLVRLLPAVLVGLGLGALFISRVDDTVMRRAIGAVLIALVGLHLMMRRLQNHQAGAAGEPDTRHPHAATAWGFGSLAGFTTMVANAGGPAMSLYLLAARFGVLGFMGTTSWFFFVLNLIKVPISASLHLITGHTLLLDLVLVPAVLAGTWLGRAVIARMDQRLFETLVLITTVLSGVNLLR